MAGPNTKHYDVSDGPMAQLLRIVRDAPAGEGLTVSQLYERATSDGVGVHSRRHMKGLLQWMKKIGRVRTVPTTNAQGKIIRGKNYSFHITEVGETHIAKIDEAAGVDRAPVNPPEPLASPILSR